MPVKYNIAFLNNFKPFFLGENEGLYNKYKDYILFPEFTNMQLSHLNMVDADVLEWQAVVFIWKDYLKIK